MARKLVINGHDFTSEIVPGQPTVDWDAVKAAYQAFQGQATQGSVLLRDPGGLIRSDSATWNIPAHSSVEITEDASGVERRIGWGRVVPKSFQHGRQRADRAKEVTVTYEDRGVDLRGLIVEDFDRPEEDDVARVLALVAYILNGAASTSPRARDSTALATTYVANANLVTMEAKRYHNVTPHEVLAECADLAGKLFFPTIDDELFYDIEESAAYDSGIRISDRLADVDNITTFMPRWMQGDSYHEDGQELLSGVKLTWGDSQEVLVTDAATEALYDKWEEVISDGFVASSAEAAAMADGVLYRRRFEDRTSQPSIRVPAESLHIIKPGQRVQIKARRIPEAVDSFVYRRVGRLEAAYIDQSQGWLHLQLDKPRFVVRRRSRGAARAAAQAVVGETISSGILLASCLPGSETPVGGFPWDWTGGSEPSTTGFGSCAGPASIVWGEGIDTNDPDGGNSEFLNHDAGCKDFAVTPGDLLLVSITGAILGYPPPAAVKLTMTYFDGACTIVAADEQFITLGAWSNFDFAWHGGWETGTGQFVVPVGATRASMRLGTEPVGFTGWLQGASVSISTPPTGECYQEEGA